MYGVQPPPRPRKPGTVTAVEVIMAVKAGLLCTAVGALCLGLVLAVLDRDSGGIETWMIATLFALATGREPTILLVLVMAASIAVIGCATHRTAFVYCRTR